MELAEVRRALARRLIGDPELTAAEVASAAGVDPETAAQIWRALGFPPVPETERFFTHADAEMLRSVWNLTLRRNTDPGVLIQHARVIGQSLARVAEAQLAAADPQAVARLRASPETGLPAEEIERVVESLAPALEPFLGYVWRRHLLAAVYRSATGDQTGGRALTVGFADLVGFTAISQQLEESELAAMVDRFEKLAYDHIPERGGRVVKMIGDEVMFVVEDDVVAAEIALALVAAYAGDDTLPDVRVGLASGPALSWEGDLFGPTVNLASRLVNIARPGTVLVSEQLGARLQAHPSFDLRHLRALHLKGIGRVRIWVLRPHSSDERPRQAESRARPAPRRAPTPPRRPTRRRNRRAR